jgi:hypothetical protein
MDSQELYKIAESDGINIFLYSLPIGVVSMSVQDHDGDCHIALDTKAIGTGSIGRLCLAHELGHCETNGFYTPNAPTTERGRMEYRADKWAVNHLVPFSLYCETILDGRLSEWEQAECWDVPPEYVSVVHKVYERTRLEDVQALREKVSDR